MSFAAVRRRPSRRRFSSSWFAMLINFYDYYHYTSLAALALNAGRKADIGIIVFTHELHFLCSALNIPSLFVLLLL